MVAQASVRASGQTTAEEMASKNTDEADKPAALEVERPINLTRAFQRMRTDWNSRDRATISSVQSIVDQYIFDNFKEAYSIMFEIYNTVREPKVDENGVVEVDTHGLPIWKQNADGSFVEDWDKIGRRERERLLYKILGGLFEWEQTAADIWGEAIFAKAKLDEAYATSFDSITDAKATVDARAARANRQAADDRYLAVYKSYCSRKAEAIIRSMTSISQRLKDLHVS